MMAHLNRFGFVAIAVVFHLVYIASIFDIYFVSPIVHGMSAHAVPRPSGAPAPAQRLVLIVGDGLRADKAFQSFPDPSPPDPHDPEALRPRPLMPFLRSRVEKHGTFGVSHTRVPTESRPGHVALIAGLYEDVSAVTTGWQLNPVNFDSVFNRSRQTWSWGSPDILPMFKEGAVEGRIYADTYSEEAEDFTADATELDTWVFDRVEQLFENAASDAHLNKSLRQDKVVFFLHLLGLDTTGHGFRPYSREYLHNIKVVDQGVRRISRLIESFYGDDRTAFVFTADHGMSDWGSHGDGHPDNTRTPLVAWGAGVRKPQRYRTKRAPGHEDGFSSDWGFDHVARHDVAQADVAALMAYLVGLEFPVNSVGELPLAYVAAGPQEQAEAMLANVRGVLEMYKVKEEHKRATELRYRPYPAFADGENRSIEHHVDRIRDLIEARRYQEAIADSRELLRVGLEGLRYLQTYDWLFLRVLVSLGYLGWMAFAVATVVDLHVLRGSVEPARTPSAVGAFAAVLASLYLMFLIQRSPVSYYAYAAFPIAFWEEAFARRNALASGWSMFAREVGSLRDALPLALKALGFIGLLQALALSYHHREIYSICYLLAVTWPFFYGRGFWGQNKALVANWAVGCISMSGFTFLPAIKVESSNTVLLGGVLMLGVGVLYLLFDHRILAAAGFPRPDGRTLLFSRSLLGAQVGLIVLAMIVTRSSIASLQAKKGLPVGNQIVGWAVLVASFAIPFLHRLYPNKHYLHRLVIIFVSFSPTFVILTISYEGLFFFAYFVTLVTWVRLEHHIYAYRTRKVARPASPLPTPKPLREAISSAAAQLTSSEVAPRGGGGGSSSISSSSGGHPYRALTLSDARVALYFFYLLQSGFFSTGNVASVSSFSLESVYRLIPVFSPFSQGALLMLKLMVPFAAISACLGILNRRLEVAPSALFMAAMAMCDALTLNFFWTVRDEGSWLDIGTSISHFAIASLLCAFVALLELASEVFVSGVEVEVRSGRRGDEGGREREETKDKKGEEEKEKRDVKTRRRGMDEGGMNGNGAVVGGAGGRGGINGVANGGVR